jgi:hypothetical protein
VSRATGVAGVPANGSSSRPSVSSDGRYVAFESSATNLDPDVTGDESQVYLRDMQAGTTTLVSRASGASGNKSNAGAGAPSISGDGQRVAFLSAASNFGPGAPEDFEQVYVRDMHSFTTTLASRATGASGARANDSSAPPAISGDGRYVALSSRATNLSPDDADSTGDVFLRDLQASTTTLASRATGAFGSKANDDSGGASVSADGRYVSFLSLSTNLSPDDSDAFYDVYVRDMQTGLTSLESRGSPGYPRPRGATPIYAPLVPAYGACTSPDRVHAAPLASQSCSGPALASGTLTTGTPDANGASPNFIGAVRLKTIIGRPRCCDTDVAIAASLTDVRRSADLSDYTGELQLRLPLQLTDRLNDVDRVQPGTVQSVMFPVTIPCGATVSTTIGSTCSVATEANVVMPGAVADQRHTVWQVGAISVYDGGPDGDVDTPAGDTLFATQGLFTP